MLTLLRLSLRQMVGVRLLLALLVTALAVGLSVLVAALTGDEGVQGEMIGVLFDGLMIGAILPIVTMVLATAAFGNELEDRTLSYIVLKPLARWRIALPKLLASVVVTGPLLAVAGFVMTAILLDGDVRASVAAGVALLVGVLVYSSIFTWAGVMFGSGSAALGAAIVYVFIWEGLIGTFLGGIRYLSVRGYTLAIMQGIDEESFEEFADRVIELPAAVVERPRSLWSSSLLPSAASVGWTCRRAELWSDAYRSLTLDGRRGGPSRNRLESLRSGQSGSS